MRVLLVAYDSGSLINYFPMGLAYVASKMRREGCEVAICSMDKYHFTDDQLRDYLIERKPDIVGTGMCAGYWQYAQLLRIARVVNSLEPKPLFYLGGHLVSPAIDYFRELTGADYICPGEYDYTDDLDNRLYPAWDLFDIDFYSLIRLPHADYNDRCFPVLSGRGCPFHCTFCYRMSDGYRARSVGSIINEVTYLKYFYYITYIDFADELLMTDFHRPVEIAEAMGSLNLKWMCNGRLNYARPDVLKRMKEAGCVFINYGIEAVDDDVLRTMRKNLTVDQITEGVENTLAAGISPGLNIIWGNIGDTVETLSKAVDFLLKFDDHSQMRTIRPVTPYPGSELYELAVNQGRIKGVDDFYENLHTNSDLASVEFTGLSNDAFHFFLRQANSRLIDHYLEHKRKEYEEDLHRLYECRDNTFRGFRTI